MDSWMLQRSGGSREQRPLGEAPVSKKVQFFRKLSSGFQSPGEAASQTASAHIPCEGRQAARCGAAAWVRFGEVKGVHPGKSKLARVAKTAVPFFLPKSAPLSPGTGWEVMLCGSQCCICTGAASIPQLLLTSGGKKYVPCKLCPSSWHGMAEADLKKEEKKCHSSIPRKLQPW